VLRLGCLRLVALLALVFVLGCGPREVTNSDVDSAPSGALLAADQRLRSGDRDGAGEAFEALAAAYPDSWGAARGLQDVRRMSMQPAQFEALYSAAQEAAPESALAWYLLGRARIERFSESLAAFETAQRLAPRSPWPPAGIAYLHWASGNMYLCLKAYEAGIERMPRSARLRLLIGNQLLNLRLVVHAQRHLEFAQRLAPEDPSIVAALGKVYIELGRYPAGRALLESALQLDATQSDVAMSLASVYLHDREPQRAEGLYRRALEGGLPADEALYGAIRAAKIVEQGASR